VVPGFLSKKVFSYKYFGIILSSNLCEKDDITRATDRSDINSGILFTNFLNVDSNVKMKLFNALCMSSYVSEHWTNRSESLRYFKQSDVVYPYV